MRGWRLANLSHLWLIEYKTENVLCDSSQEPNVPYLSGENRVIVVQAIARVSRDIRATGQCELRTNLGPGFAESFCDIRAT